MHFQLTPWVSLSGQIWMQLFVTMLMLYMLWKYRSDSLLVFLVLLFFQRVFIFMGKNVENLYKVSLLLMCLYTCWERKVWKRYTTNDLGYILTFIVLTASFFYSTIFYSHDGWTIIFSQYAKYLEMFLLWFILKDAILYRNEKDKILPFLYFVSQRIFCRFLEKIFFDFTDLSFFQT